MAQRVGILLPTPNDGPHLAAFREAMAALGRREPGGIELEIRTAAEGRVEEMELLSRELVAAAPELIVTASSPAAQALAAATREIPIVFVNVFDPVALGLVANLSQPGGNLTGIFGFPTDIAATWVGLLQEIAPHVSRMGLLFHPESAAAHWRTHLRAAMEGGAAHGRKVVPVPLESLSSLEPTVSALADMGLVVVPSTFMATHRAAIAAAMAAHMIPAIYGISPMVRAGGLLSFGPDIAAQWRAAASYVDRILRGAAPSDLAVERAPLYELTVNSRTASQLGLLIPTGMRARANVLEL